QGEETDHPTMPSQSYQLSQPQDYPQGLYQAYLTARQNEGGTQYQAQSSAEGDVTIITTTNPAQQLTARFSDQGVNLEGLQVELSRVGYAGTGESETALELAQGVEPVAEGNRIAYQSATSLSQWYLNG